MVHSSPIPLPATNIRLLQQARRAERKKAMKQFDCFGGRFSFDLQEILKREQSPAVQIPRGQGQSSFSYVIAYGMFSHATGEQDWISQSKRPPLLPWSLTAAVQTCPPWGLFVLAIYRAVYFLIRECLLKTLPETSQMMDNQHEMAE